jgi:hypothetical protein
LPFRRERDRVEPARERSVEALVARSLEFAVVGALADFERVLLFPSESMTATRDKPPLMIWRRDGSQLAVQTSIWSLRLVATL